MKKNRKIPKRQSVMVRRAEGFLGLIVLFSVMAIFYQFSSSSCAALHKSIGEKEMELRKLEDACDRERTRWEGMKTPDRIEMALLKHGLKMNVPRPDQYVRMKADGVPYPGQLSVARVRQRSGVATTALYHSGRR